MLITLLGPLRVGDDDGRAVVVGGDRLRALLAMLALTPGRPVPTGRLVAGLWGDQPPAGTNNALQSLISRLRRILTDGAELRSEPAGYLLEIPRQSVDTERFAALAADGRRRLSTGDPHGAADALAAALRLWRGPALVDVAAPFAGPVASRLDADRADAIADLADAHLAAGQPDRAAELLTGPVAEQPLSERFCGLAIRALTATGRQADALACYERTRRALADELGVDPSPQLAAVHVAMLRGELAHPDTDERADRVGRTNLRATLSSFIGREREMAEVRRLLADARLVTFVGPGGAGKTRLATEAAAGLAARYPDGVWLVQLAPVSDPVEVPHAVLAALGSPEPAVVTASQRAGRPAVLDREEHLLAELASRRLLLILDNCEHLVDAAARLADTLLARCPEVRVLATSRSPLGITGERLYPVPPLDLPGPGADLATARASAAVRLLSDRAAAVRPGFEVHADNVAAVTQICRRLDGAPLALELAAARLRAFTPAQLADRLDDRFRLLSTGNRAALPRHQTLHAVVSWSWELLSPAERVLARRLSVFPGGATLDTVEQVCADPADPGRADAPPGELPAGAVLDALGGLVDKSLVETVDGTPAVRYRMLETIRAYAADQLAAAADDRTREAHLRYYLRLAESTDPLLRSGRQQEAMALFGAEHDNLLAALRHCVERRDADHALRIGAALLWYWFLLGYATDGSFWLGEIMRVAPKEPRPGLAAAQALCYLGSVLDRMLAMLGDPDGMAAMMDRFERLAARAAAEGPMPAILKIARIFPPVMRGGFDDSRAALDDLVDDEDPWTAAACHLLRANLLQDALNSAVRAGADAVAAVDGFRTLGDRWGLAMALVGYGEYLVMAGDLPGAADTLAEAWQVASGSIPERDRPNFLVRLAGIRVRAGDVDTAERDLAHAARLSAALPPDDTLRDHDWFQPELVQAEVHRHRRRYPQARDCYRTVLERAADDGTKPPQLTGIAYAGLARVEHEDGCDEAAADLLAAGLTAVAPTRDMPVLALLLEALVVTATDDERVAVVFGALGALRRDVTLHDPGITDAVTRASAALGAEAFDAARARGVGLDFVGIYDYLGVPVGPPGPHADRQPQYPL
ncbi:MAG: BTAD domain-containing putative transcriptional regulator [Actinocatenispora sp.]